MRSLLSVLLGLTGVCGVSAQQVYKSYPAPVMTEEVQALKNASVLWKSRNNATPLPASVDNSLNKYFPPVFSQLGGSCAQSSGIRYLFTYEMNRVLGRPADIPANIFSYFYTWNFINEGKDQGGFAEEGLSIARNCGVMSLAEFPDQSSAYAFRWMSGYDKYIRAMHYRVSNVLTLEVTNQEGIDNLKRYLYNEGNGGHLVTYSANAQNWKINDHYTGPSQTGYKSLLTQLATEGAHAMTIVGYDDTVEFMSPSGLTYGAFIVVNSYGEWFHDKGRYYLPYYFFLQERASNLLSHNVTGMEATYHTPKLIFKMKVSYNSRNDLAVLIGAADKPYAESPSVSFPSSIINNQGGDHPMQGAYEGNDLEIAFDASSLVSKMEGFKEPKFFLSVVRSQRGTLGSGVINHFSVLDYREDPENPKEYVCRDIQNTELLTGTNLFTIATTPLLVTSASGFSWMDAMQQLYQTTFVVRTAKGRYAKVQFLEYDKGAGKVKIKYLYQPDGSQNLKSVL